MRLKLGGKWWSFTVNRRLKVNDGIFDRTSEPPRFVVSRELEGKAFLDALVHEMIHACGNDDETWVDRSATEIANALWKIGYRRIEQGK